MEEVYRQQLIDFLDSELEDKTHFPIYEIQLTEYIEDECASYTVTCSGYSYTYFKVKQDGENLTLFIEQGGDWKEIEYFEWTVKYFWMELLRR